MAIYALQFVGQFNHVGSDVKLSRTAHPSGSKLHPFLKYPKQGGFIVPEKNPKVLKAGLAPRKHRSNGSEVIGFSNSI